MYQCIAPRRKSGGTIDETLQQRHGRRIELAAFVRALERVVAPLTEFDESLWGAMVERVTVFEGKRVVVGFKNGDEV